MADYTDREHYIPLRRNELIDLLCGYEGVTDEEREKLRTVSRLLASLFHFEFLKTIEEVGNDYAPFDPDRETVALQESSPNDKIDKLDKLFTTFGFMLQKANYRHITEEQLKQALNSRSRWGLTMNVDFSIFDRLSVYYRGDAIGRRVFRNWRKWWREEEVEVPVYRRLVIMLRLRDEAKGKIGREVNSAGVYVKSFKDIPKDDVEMLLPGARLVMNRFDKTKVSFPLLTFLAITAWNVFKVVLAGVAAGPVGAGAVGVWSLAVGSGAYGYRSYTSYNLTKSQYSLQLTRSLYYQNLDNNAGVFYSLLNEAEQQEWREAILGYFCVLKLAPPAGYTLAEIDDCIEAFLEKHTTLKVDFEIKDAVHKLERLKLVTQTEGRYRGVPLEEAVEQLHDAWDLQFQKTIRARKVETAMLPSDLDKLEHTGPQR
jgi:hypothetical protein